MNISANQENINKKKVTFSKIEKAAFNMAMEIGRQLIKSALEEADMDLMAERDTARYRNKGPRRTCIKTICGTVEFERRVYEDKAAEGRKFTYLLDEALGMNCMGKVSESVCRLISSSICESTFRSTSRQVTDLTGLDISHQAVWNIVQQIGESQEKLAERHAELAKEKQGTGKIDTPILYEENDGIWLKLQGKDRKENGPSKEMKMGIAYDGVIFRDSDRTGKRTRMLDNKLAIAGFMPIDEFRDRKEGLVSSVFRTSKIELRVINGDGAAWIQKKAADTTTISVLDEFHRNKKIRECVKNRDHAEQIAEELYKGDYDGLLEFIEALQNSVDDDKEIEGLKELYSYYSENREALPGYYDRGIEIPETRAPGEIHHARLGSMESNVFTLIGNRMKGRRRNWSIDGANHLASILCAYHTAGFENLFADLPAQPIKEPEWMDTGRPLTPREIGEYTGRGFEYPAAAETTGGPVFLREIAKVAGIGDLNFI